MIGDDVPRQSVEALAGLQLNTANGEVIPLRSLATFRYDTEQPVINQRNRVPTIMVKAGILSNDQPATIVSDLANQIEVLREKGRHAWDAVYEASDSRPRPIVLTAAAASLALFPISNQIFWELMAFAMMGGIIVGTAVTLVFVPALYIAVFRVSKPAPKPKFVAAR